MTVKENHRLGPPFERASRWMFTRIIAGLARTLRNEELTVAQLAALHVVDQAGELRQSDLARELALTPSTASRMVDAMVQRDLLDRRESPDDRRSRVLRVAPHGVELLERFGGARLALFERVTRRVPRTVVKVMLGAIERVRTEARDA